LSRQPSHKQREGGYPKKQRLKVMLEIGRRGVGKKKIEGRLEAVSYDRWLITILKTSKHLFVYYLQMNIYQAR